MKNPVISPNGAVVLPKPIQRKLGVQPGDPVRFRITQEGDVVIEPENDLLDLKGTLDPKRVRLTVEDMDRISSRAAVRRK